MFFDKLVVFHLIQCYSMIIAIFQRASLHYKGFWEGLLLGTPPAGQSSGIPMLTFGWAAPWCQPPIKTYVA